MANTVFVLKLLVNNASKKLVKTSFIKGGNNI